MALTIDGTSDVLAGLPAIFGFVPRHSLVLLSTLHHTDRFTKVGPMNRADLGYVVADPAPAVDAFARQVGDLPVQNVLAAMIRPSTNPADDTDLPRRDTADTITTLLNDHGFTDIDVVHVPDIAAGARWRSYQTPGRTGVLPDPASTVFAAAAAAEGRIVADRRQDLVARFSPAPAPLRERLHHPIAAAIVDAGLDADKPAAALARLARADAAIRAASEGTLPTDETAIVDLVATFVTIPFFDALIAVDGGLHLGVENLVMHLWRHACDPGASRLATVIAMHAYQRGDGVTARIALETADLQQPLPRLLLEMLDRCVPPTQIRTLAQEMSRDTRDKLLGAQPTDKS
ncbi:DUF4192 domain-containing protein [Amycolatopsis plumensis]|uniref:DUF4192 domain-containing protein n=1 Tax=Amycolatopsis plumensis TaxID=236508 RepID=A0ABV5U8C1_9PSEU